MSNKDDSPILEPPKKTAVDDFLTSSLMPTSTSSTKPNQWSSRHGRNASHARANANSVALKPSSTGSKSALLRPPLVSNGISGKFAKRKDLSVMTRTMSSSSNGPHSHGVGARKAKAIVSPLASSPTKSKMSRKIMNKLKRKRLLETSNECQVDLFFSSKVVPCDVHIPVRSSQSQQGSVKAEPKVMGMMRPGHGTLYANAIISLNGENLSWPLHSETSSGIQDALTTRCTHSQMNLFHEAARQYKVSFMLSTRSEDSHSNISIEAIAHMLKAMHAGLFLTYRSESGDNDDEFSFFVIPDKDVSAQKLGLVCVWDDMNSKIDSDKMAEERIIDGKIDAGLESNHDSNNLKAAKRMKMTHEQCVQDAIIETPQKENINTEDGKPLRWDELIVQYESCLAQNKDAPSPITFSRQKLHRAVKTLWEDADNENVANIPSKDVKLQKLFGLLRPPKGEKEKNGKVLLKLKSELSEIVRSRPERKISTPQSEDEQSSAVTNKDMNNTDFAKQDQYVQMILLQVLIRLELFVIHNNEDMAITNFLNIYAKCTATNKKLPSKKKSKKKRKQKNYTIQDFVAEICSIAELFTFVLPSPESFSAFMNEQVLKPYQPSAPEMIVEIADFFEIDLPANDEGESEEDSDDFDLMKKKDASISDSNQSPPDEPVSRWSTAVISKPAVPSSSPAKQETPKEEATTVKEEEEPGKILFENKVDLAVKTKQGNPLLAGKTRYVGRQFSNNYFREVKVTKSTTIKKEKAVAKPAKLSRNPVASNSLNTPHQKESKVAASLGASSSSFRNRQASNTAASLGASSSSFRSKQSSKDNFINRPKGPRPSKSKPTSPPKRHRHAAVMAALAAMRKKR